MTPPKDPPRVKGHVHGGAPFGMKGEFRAVTDSTAAEHEGFFASAGRAGPRPELGFSDLSKALDYEIAGMRG